jgi:hypothetical protein
MTLREGLHNQAARKNGRLIAYRQIVYAADHVLREKL